MNRVNPDVSYIVLARPSDGLTAAVHQVLPQDRLAFCTSVYAMLAALLRLAHDTPVLLVTRPSMLAEPALGPILAHYPNLRLIGWVGSYERVTLPVGLSMVTVSSPEELAAVAAAIGGTLTDGPAIRPAAATPRRKLDPGDYRLSDAERDALLGAG